MSYHAGLEKIPSLRISTSELCNQRCGFCQVEGDFSSHQRGIVTEARAAIWQEKIVASAKRFFDLGVRHFSLTGGEPLINWEFSKMVAEQIRGWLDLEQAHQRVAYPASYLRLNTNGTKLPRYADDVARLFDLTKISLHTRSPERYAAITNSRNPESDLSNTLEGIKLLTDRGAKVRIHSVLTKHTVADLSGLLELCLSNPGIIEWKIFDMSPYERLWRWGIPESGEEYWEDNFQSLDCVEEFARKAGAVPIKIEHSIGGYGNPMNLFQLTRGSSFEPLILRLRRSDRGAFYSPDCEQCPAFNICVDGHCNLEIGPNQVIKICRPESGIVFPFDQEQEALEYLRFLAVFQSRPDLRLAQLTGTNPNNLEARL